MVTSKNICDVQILSIELKPPVFNSKLIWQAEKSSKIIILKRYFWKIMIPEP